MLHALEDILSKGIVEAKQQFVEDEGVDPDLRGWNFNSPKLKVPKQNVTLPMYKIADGYCPNDRKRFWVDVKGKRTKKSKPLIYGSVIHQTVEALIDRTKGFIYNPDQYLDVLQTQLKEDAKVSPAHIGMYLAAIQNQTIEAILEKNKVESFLKRKILTTDDITEMRSHANRLWFHEMILATGRVHYAMASNSKYGHYPTGDALVKLAVPMSIESVYDGTNLGMGRVLHIDSIVLNRGIIVSDIKTGRPRDFHDLTVTGYGLVLEEKHKQPVNAGVIVYPSFPNNSDVPEIYCEVYAITNELREKFIEKRNRDLIMVADKVDPGPPPKGADCPGWCDFYDLCQKG